MPDFVPPQQSIETLSLWGLDALTSVIAVDSQSNEDCPEIPSSPGQVELSNQLRTFFSALGLDTEQDRAANLLVRLPSRGLPQSSNAPKLALMVHMDTSMGTMAVPALSSVSCWNGSRIEYPQNPDLNVSVANYEVLSHFVGEDVVHGPGRYPIGLDNKLGVAELMVLARLLKENPAIPHGELFLVFRPDEEIGRMESVRGLAQSFEERGIGYGYTIDGILPHEINIENFNASLATVRLRGRPLELPGRAGRLVTLAITGVSTHGAVAKSEGHLNSTAILSGAFASMPEGLAIPVVVESDAAKEANAEIRIAVFADSSDLLDGSERRLLEKLSEVIQPHAWKGAKCEVLTRQELTGAERYSDAARRLVGMLRRFIESEGPRPRLAEESDGYQGYSNPFFVSAKDGEIELSIRLRAFSRPELDSRERHVREIFAADPACVVEVRQQYVNMGPELSNYPELVEWARSAAEGLDREVVVRPIRGGTGVDPFIERGIPLANLGTGYFAPESEKELTSLQNLARHVIWLSNLVQVVARQRS